MIYFIFLGTSESDFTDSDFTDREFEELFQNNLNKKTIFEGSLITIPEFSFSFLSTCQKMKLSFNSCSIFLQFIQSILPVDSNIPKSYSRILKTSNLMKKICNVCHVESNNPSCESNDCKKIAKKDNYQTPASVICLDYVKKFEYILTKNYELINQYKGK